MLEVDLASGKSLIRPLDERTCEDYIGGLGLGMKILYDKREELGKYATTGS
jgi:aldehyde:ferredoxin oxidoreductase